MGSKLFFYYLLTGATSILTIILLLKILNGQDGITDLWLAVFNGLLMFVKEKLRIELKKPNRFLDPVYESFRKEKI